MGKPKLFQCLMAHESEEIPSRFRGQRVSVQRKWAIYSEEMGGFARAGLFRGLGRVWTSWLLRIGAAQRAYVVVRVAKPPRRRRRFPPPRIGRRLCRTGGRQ